MAIGFEEYGASVGNSYLSYQESSSYREERLLLFPRLPFSMLYMYFLGPSFVLC